MTEIDRLRETECPCDVEKLYLAAMSSYTQARELLRLWREAVGLGADDGFARKRFELGLKAAQGNAAALGRARGIRT